MNPKDYFAQLYDYLSGKAQLYTSEIKNKIEEIRAKNELFPLELIAVIYDDWVSAKVYRQEEYFLKNQMRLAMKRIKAENPNLSKEDKRNLESTLFVEAKKAHLQHSVEKASSVIDNFTLNCKEHLK